MAKELIHKDAGPELSRSEDNAIDRHYITGGVADDMVVYNATTAGLEGRTPTEILAILDGGGLGDIVGTTAAQVLTNKTLTAPVINGATIIGDAATIEMGDGAVIRSGLAANDLFYIDLYDANATAYDHLMTFYGGVNVPYITIGVDADYLVKFEQGSSGIYFGDSINSWDTFLWGRSTEIQIRNAANNAYSNLKAAILTLTASLNFEAAASINARGTAADYYMLKAYKAAQVEVARAQGSAADPWFGLGVNGAGIKVTNANLVGFFGTAPVSQLLKANFNNWAAFGDVVDALVSIGLFDVA